MHREIYLDHQTISRPSPAVIERMSYYFREKWGVLSAPHQKGQELYPDVDGALKKLYTFLGASETSHFILTSGGFDAAFQLFMNFYLDEIRETGRSHIATSCVEEAPILLSLSHLEQLGCMTKLLPVDNLGRLKLEPFKPKTSLLSLSYANALTGVIEPVQEIIAHCHAHDVKVHLNASAVIGKLPLSFEELGADFLSFDGDKIHTPQGIGGLFQRKKPHQSSHHVAALSALSLAIEEEVGREFFMEAVRLRDAFEAEIKHALPDSVIVFQEADRLPHISCIAFPGVLNESLLYYLHRKKVYASLGGGQFQKLSAQLKTCGVSDDLCHSAVSFAISHETTEDDLAEALDHIVSSVRKLSTLSAAL